MDHNVLIGQLLPVDPRDQSGSRDGFLPLQQAAAKGPEGKEVEELLTEPVPQRLLTALVRRIEVGPKTEGAQKICIYYRYNGAVSL